MINRILLVIVFANSFSSVIGEPIRGRVGEVIVLSESASVFSEVRIKPLSLTLVEIENPQYLKALKISATLSQRASNHHFALGLFCYKDIPPETQLNSENIRGSRLFMHPLPTNTENNFLLPLLEEANKRQAGFFMLPMASNIGKSLVFTIQPIEKGVPDFVYEDDIRLTIQPVIIDKGMIHLIIEGITEGEDVDVTIDELPIKEWDSPIEVSSGTYIVRAQTPTASAIAEVIVEPGMTRDVELTLLSNSPSVRVNAPTGTEILINGERIEDFSKAVFLEAGNHRAIFIRDGEQKVVDFTLLPGEEVLLSLIWDVKIDK